MSKKTWKSAEWGTKKNLNSGLYLKILMPDMWYLCRYLRKPVLKIALSIFSPNNAFWQWSTMLNFTYAVNHTNCYLLKIAEPICSANNKIPQNKTPLGHVTYHLLKQDMRNTHHTDILTHTNKPCLILPSKLWNFLLLNDTEFLMKNAVQWG